MKLGLLGFLTYFATIKSVLAESLDGESSDEAGHCCSSAEIEGAFIAFCNGFITEAGLSVELTNMGAELTDDEVSHLVRVIREAGGGI